MHSAGKTQEFEGLAPRAWALFTHAAGVATLVKGFNVASVTRTAGGTFDIAFTAALPSTAVVLQAVGHQSGAVLDARVSVPAVGTMRIVTQDRIGGLAADPDVFYIAFHG